MQHIIKSVMTTLLLALVPTVSFAHGDAGIATEGGLLVGSKSNPYWFQVSGAMKLDQRVYFGDTNKTSSPINPAGTYESGAYIRDLGLSLDGGIGHDFTYTLALNFKASDSKVSVDDAFVTYHGFKHLAPNFTFSVGQVIPGFCVSCATSSKWIPFMERSMGTNVFGPQQGLGVSANTYNDHYSLTLAATQQPKTGSSLKDPSGNTIRKHDLWQGSGRFTYYPISEAGKVLQVGLSAHIQEHSNTGVQFAATPEMRSGNSTTLLNTTTILNGNSRNNSQLIAAKNQKTIDIEMLGIHGPWSGELEYQKAFIARGLTTTGVKQGKNLSFSGYHAQVSYVLTGETRPHKKSNGTLGQIKPHSKKGAWEVSGRYSFITLNDKDVSGGMAHNTAASLSWYANNNIRVIGEYVFSKQSRQFATYLDKRNVNSVGARLQVVF